jgi:hypothetical protein
MGAPKLEKTADDAPNDAKNGLPNRGGVRKLRKAAHADRGQEPKWEIPNETTFKRCQKGSGCT